MQLNKNVNIENLNETANLNIFFAKLESKINIFEDLLNKTNEYYAMFDSLTLGNKILIRLKKLFTFILTLIVIGFLYYFFIYVI